LGWTSVHASFRNPLPSLEPSHLQCIHDQIRSHLTLHRPAHHAAAEQVDHCGCKQPTLLGRDIGDVARSRLVRRQYGEFTIQKVRIVGRAIAISLWIAETRGNAR
jgi:hypothetical protein